MASSPAQNAEDVVQAPLPQVAGYLIVVVLGLIIALVMMGVTKVLKRTAGEDNKRTEIYGVSGPFWFAAGCSPMIVFFALLGISCKRKIPEAHTSLEVVRIRYGKIVH
ncbi:hypothetical protein ACP6JC_001226 [Aspergillus fumigatus]